MFELRNEMERRWKDRPVAKLKFLALFVGYILYLIIGACVFDAIESPREEQERLDLFETRKEFLQGSCVTDEELEAFIVKIVEATNRGISAVRNVTSSNPNWSFGQSLFFAGTVITTIGQFHGLVNLLLLMIEIVRKVTSSNRNWSFGQSLFFAGTVITTIGYGRVTPLSEAGKAFCVLYAIIGIPLTLILLTAIVERFTRRYGRVTPLSEAGKAFCVLYAIIGIPLTLILLTAIVERLMIVTSWLLQVMFKNLGHLYKVFHIQLMHLSFIILFVVIFFYLIPAAIYCTLEPKWNYLDAFYYCFISLTTIGLGDYIPGDNPDQELRPLYKVATTFYLFLGLIMMILILEVFYEIPELNIGFHFYLKSDDEETERMRLHSSATASGQKYSKQIDDENQSAPVTSEYQGIPSFPRQQLSNYQSTTTDGGATQ